jgi:phage terminase large subunit
MNPFLTQAQINEIEGLKEKDEALYTIFALGERAMTRENIFSNWEFIDKKPERFTNYIYGIDYGFTHPTALVKVWYYEDEIYIEDVMYDAGKTSSDIVARFKTLGLTHKDTIIAEVARPEINQELRRENFSIIDADKSVKGGINDVQRTKVYTSSKNVWKEYENYSWRKVNGQLTEEPVKILDDIMDATRYAVRYIVKYYRGSTKTYTFR